MDSKDLLHKFKEDINQVKDEGQPYIHFESLLKYFSTYEKLVKPTE